MRCMHRHPRAARRRRPDPPPPPPPPPTHTHTHTTHPPTHPPTHRSLRKMVRNEGWVSLYRGVTAPLLGNMVLLVGRGGGGTGSGGEPQGCSACVPGARQCASELAGGAMSARRQCITCVHAQVPSCIADPLCRPPFPLPCAAGHPLPHLLQDPRFPGREGRRKMSSSALLRAGSAERCGQHGGHPSGGLGST